MGATTEIAWTDATWSPWHGCARVSPGCANCYAETFSKRIGKDIWGKDAPRRFLSDHHWAQPLKWDRNAAERGSPTLVFCASMADVFEDRDDLFESRQRLFELIAATPNLIWQLLTKRPENVELMVPLSWLVRSLWPENVWIGTTVEDQQRADERLPVLFDIPAQVRFVSFEPLLGKITLDRWLLGEHGFYRSTPRLQWAIVGGESGAKRRPLNLFDAQHLVGQLQQACVPTFFKQVGGLHPKSGGDTLNGRRYHEFPKEAKR